MSLPSQTSLEAAKAAIAQVLRETGQIRIIAATMLAFVVITVSVRMYVRIRMLRQFAAEDWSMLCFSTGQCCIAISVVEFGQQAVRGRPRPVALNDTLAKWSTGMFALALTTLKISLGFFFLHLFSHKRPHRIAIILLVLLSTLTGLAYFAFSVFTCTVLLKPPGTELACAIQPVAEGVFYAFSVTSIAGDFVLVLMALFTLWKAKIPLPTKALACFLLGLGAVGGVASTIRFALLARPVTVRNFRQSVYDVGKWTIIEHTTGVVAANLAMTRPLLHALFKKLRFGASMWGSRKMSEKGGSVGVLGPKGTAGSGFARIGGEERDVRQVENNGEAYLLHEIKKEVAVRVDEEQGKSQGSKGSDREEFEREFGYAGRRY
ncbi:Hypothetical protein D9617_8g050440 [Elsinoe fawcettii]|nr:Hypothetical protein D9617_8g050440 [Elsinoe fawcettii]